MLSSFRRILFQLGDVLQMWVAWTIVFNGVHNPAFPRSTLINSFSVSIEKPPLHIHLQWNLRNTPRNWRSFSNVTTLIAHKLRPYITSLTLSYGLFLNYRWLFWPVFFITKQVFKKSYNRNCPRARKNCNTFQDVANELKNKYDSAINKTNKPLSAGVFQRNTMQVLTYRDPSPDYCVRNVTAGSPGLKERVCGNSGRKTRQCRSLCRRCGLKLKRVNCTNCSVKNTVTVCKQKNPKH